MNPRGLRRKRHSAPKNGDTPKSSMSKQRKFMVSEDGVHLMHGEFTLCGDAFDIDDRDGEPDAPVMRATSERTGDVRKVHRRHPAVQERPDRPAKPLSRRAGPKPEPERLVGRRRHNSDLHVRGPRWKMRSSCRWPM